MFGVVGLSYFIDGKKALHIVARMCGLALMVFPYVVSNTYAIVGIGLGLMVLPFINRV